TTTLCFARSAAPASSFFFTTSPSPEISTLSLDDALPISRYDSVRQVLRKIASRRRPPQHRRALHHRFSRPAVGGAAEEGGDGMRDRKSTRLNSSHVAISYAVFCLKKKKKKSK